MAFRFIVIFCFLAPLVGTIQMENGAYGGSVLQAGHANYASLAFAFGATVFGATIFGLHRLKQFEFGGLAMRPAPSGSSWTLWISIAVLTAMAAYTLFAAGGINVALRSESRGDFRTGLGGNGALSYLCLKFYSPAILAYLALLYQKRPWHEMALSMVIPAILVSLVALSFGFKSGIVLAFLPAVIAYSWRFSALWIFPLCAAALGAIYLGYLFFDSAGPVTYSNTLVQLWLRLTVMQGDVAWKIWDMHRLGSVFPSYIDTLPAILGDRVASWLTGVDRTTPMAWVLTHFGLLITYLSGYPIDQIMAGHNNTATIFSEGILAGGLPGVFVISAIAGVLTYALYRFIDVCLQRNHLSGAAIAASYFVFGLMSWLLGGGVTAIVHISILVGIVTTYILLRIIEGRTRRVPQ